MGVWPLDTRPSPPPAWFLLHPPSAGFWGDYNTHHIFSPHLPTSDSSLINMQWAHWYSNCVLCCDLINEIWLLAWLLEMDLVFWNTKDGRSGREKRPWEAKNAWRAEASPCQLDCRSLISLQHLRMSVAVITATTSHRWRGSGRNEYPFMKKSQTRVATRAEASSGNLTHSPAGLPGWAEEQN